MLAKMIRFEEEATLIMRSGVQFMDFGLTLDPRREEPGQFARRADGSAGLIRLEYDVEGDRYLHPNTHAVTRAVDDLETPLAESLDVFADVWLPVPFLRRHANAFVQGPRNWARVRIVPLAASEDTENDDSHRVVLAFDTAVVETEVMGAAYLAPSKADVDGGAKFALSWIGEDMGWFLDQPWIEGWLKDVFTDALVRGKTPPEDIAEAIAQKRHFAHYLNLLWVLGAKVNPPRIKILSNSPDDVHKPIQVDLVLDVGNSRTCGILIEDHPQEGNGLSTRYELELRDLGRPHRVYAEPFESRVEFAEAAFGKVDYSCLSGRNDAFLWPTIARVGAEATRLAARRRGTEGATGLSSPKRYLWDEKRFEPGWRFNDSFNKSETEPLATAAPFGDLIDETGEALFTLPPERQIQVFMPHYARSSLMTFMLSEILVQALNQINSPSQRMKLSHANLPRQLRSVILTVPPSMPLPERQIFEERMRQAIGLVWKAFGWHPVDLDIESDDDRKAAWPPLPSYHAKWDEATCAQVVYLFSETVNHFGGRPEEFFRVFRRRRAEASERSLRIASIDLGGGTTDLVICDYTLDEGRGGNVSILPEQKFRDGFKVAGDDIVLDIISKMVVPKLHEALLAHGVSDPDPVLSTLIGSEPGIVQDMVLRQQLTLQVLYPLGLALLKAYEGYSPLSVSDTVVMTIGEALADRDAPSTEVLDYFASGVRRVMGGGAVQDFDLLQVRLPFDMAFMHGLFLNDKMDIGKPIRSLCEIVYLYDCDVLLLSGRPSCLPGVQALFRGLLALPPDRVVPLHNYRTGNWYPFHRGGRIGDPKTTAAVGATLCVLGQGRIPNFFFRANVFRSYSTVRYIGLMDQNLTIKADDVYYHDVDLDKPGYTFPEDVSFEVRGRMVLGFRQLAAERWSGSPLYMIEFASGENNSARKALYGENGKSAVLSVKLGHKRRGKVDRPVLTEVSVADGSAMVNAKALTIGLYTLSTRGTGESSYWLDTGSIIR
ncbi:MAG: virulence factor SrfB [Rhodospirillaceae bacterium]|nr:virulence factor SrfB [Rhodospirillaceae bacterium]